MRVIVDFVEAEVEAVDIPTTQTVVEAIVGLAEDDHNWTLLCDRELKVGVQVVHCPGYLNARPLLADGPALAEDSTGAFPFARAAAPGRRRGGLGVGGEEGWVARDDLSVRMAMERQEKHIHFWVPIEVVVG